jgi:serine/threonine protein kinase
MSTGAAPFRTAAAATYCIFVSKQLPQFPDHISFEARDFLARCLTESPKARASSGELLSLPFLLNSQISQSIDIGSTTRHPYMSSTVTLNPLSDFKTLNLSGKDNGSSGHKWSGKDGDVLEGSTSSCSNNFLSSSTDNHFFAISQDR